MAETAATEPHAQDDGTDDGEQNQKHDEGYKVILSDADNFLHLLRRYFASVPWVVELLSDNVEAVRMDNSFISKEYRRMDSDIIYKLRKGGTEIYFYVLIELQSKVDYTMPFRLLRCMVKLLEYIFEDTPQKMRERKGFRLPAIVPMVLYDGDNRWTAAQTYREYTEDYEIFGDNIINFKYLLLDLNRTDAEAILPVVKLLDAVFSLTKMRFENRFVPEEINTWWAEQALRLPKDERYKLVDWMAFAFKAPVEITDSITNLLEKGDSNNMGNIFQLMANDFKEIWMREGLQEGAHSEDVKIAKYLKTKGMSIDEIAEATGLTVDEILQL
jgi:predicted transposase/invertase (TIGR01784 family)